jgi:hypothetical protein
MVASPSPLPELAFLFWPLRGGSSMYVEEEVGVEVGGGDGGGSGPCGHREAPRSPQAAGGPPVGLRIAADGHRRLSLA